MAGRASLVRAEPGFTLPFFERLSPPPPPALIAARIESDAKPGDAILDLAGRGGWVARAAVDRQRRAVSLESTPLTRLLAELVLRPPDLRHLDAAFQAMGASPRGQTSLKVAVGELFATRCATCGRSSSPTRSSGRTRARRAWRTMPTPIRGQPATPTIGRSPARSMPARSVVASAAATSGTAPLDEADLARARTVPDDLRAIRSRLRDRFPVVEGGGFARGRAPRSPYAAPARRPRGDPGPDRMRSEVGAGRGRPPAGVSPRAPAGEPAQRPSRSGAGRSGSRPATFDRRPQARGASGTHGSPSRTGFASSAVSSSGSRAVPAARFRRGSEATSSRSTRAARRAVVAIAGPSTTQAIGAEATSARGWDGSPTLRRRIRLVVGQPPVRPNQERLSMTYWATAWTLGSEAAGGLPLGRAVRAGHPRSVGLAGGGAGPIARVRGAVDRPRRPRRVLGRWRSGGARRRGARWGRGGLPAPARAPRRR